MLKVWGVQIGGLHARASRGIITGITGHLKAGSEHRSLSSERTVGPNWWRRFRGWRNADCYRQNAVAPTSCDRPWVGGTVKQSVGWWYVPIKKVDICSPIQILVSGASPAAIQVLGAPRTTMTNGVEPQQNRYSHVIGWYRTWNQLSSRMEKSVYYSVSTPIEDHGRVSIDKWKHSGYFLGWHSVTAVLAKFRRFNTYKQSQVNCM
jgi:hypothetical protein